MLHDRGIRPASMVLSFASSCLSVADTHAVLMCWQVGSSQPILTTEVGTLLGVLYRIPTYILDSNAAEVCCALHPV